MALSMAAGALFGQVLGACQTEKTQSIRKEALFFTLIIMGTMGVLFMVFRQYIISGFSPDISIRQLGVQCLIIAALEQPLMGYAMVHIGILRGAGDTKSTLYVNVIGALFIRLPLAYLLAVTLNLGLLGIWLTMPVDWLVRCIIYYFIYRTGRWKRINI
jgi:Na+-driven multidrug efflux pump